MEKIKILKKLKILLNVIAKDVKSVGPDVLRHRIAVSYEAEAEEMTSEQIVEQIFAGLPVP